jgi:HAD superfamily hydrolase (TIGR01509 family)
VEVSALVARPFAAVIFDLDGVLVDTEIWWDDVRREYATAHGRVWSLDDRASVMGANSRQWSRTMGERLRLDVDPDGIEQDVVDGMVARWAAGPSPLIPGADVVVRRLAETWPLAVASSAHRSVIDAALATTGLRACFRVVVSSDEVRHGKPAPDVYLEAARQLGVEPGDCLVVEDSFNGVLAGRSAGMTVVLVPNASIPPAAGAREAASVVLDSLGELDPAAIPRS